MHDLLIVYFPPIASELLKFKTSTLLSTIFAHSKCQDSNSMVVLFSNSCLQGSIATKSCEVLQRPSFDKWCWLVRSRCTTIKIIYNDKILVVLGKIYYYKYFFIIISKDILALGHPNGTLYIFTHVRRSPKRLWYRPEILGFVSLI